MIKPITTVIFKRLPGQSSRDLVQSANSIEGLLTIDNAKKEARRLLHEFIPAWFPLTFNIVEHSIRLTEDSDLSYEYYVEIEKDE